MRVRIGTSGFSYQEWRGAFDPAALPDAQWLTYYASRLDTVEINNTFYRMPDPAVVARWAEEVPASFLFAIKAPQRITHRARLRDVADAVAHLARGLEPLRARLGPVLFQLPPFFRQDLPRLRAFLADLPGGLRAAFEFRHASWFEDGTYDALRAAGAALCTAETDDGVAPSLVPTAAFGYVRLRRATYSDDDLGARADRLGVQPWQEAFAYFKHEDAGAAPALAERLRSRLEAG